jgi:hypothetical protein
VKVPRHGLLTGNAKLDGSPGLMQVDGAVAFDDPRHGRSRVVAVGSVGTTGTGVRFRDLDVTFDPVRVAMARVFAPTLPIGGTLRGSARLNGETNARMTIRAAATIASPRWADRPLETKRFVSSGLPEWRAPSA